MRTTKTVLALAAAVELAYYFALVVFFPVLLLSQQQAELTRLFRLLASAQLLLPAALVMLSLDYRTYARYTPLVILGKALNILTLGLALPSILARHQIANARQLLQILAIPGFCMLANLAVLSIMVYIARKWRPGPAVSVSAPAASIEEVSPIEAD